ncbi:ornithine cyclodeaminase family protein [Xanthobacter sp. DSM 14520]|uniref:ornithine cyclodeaminase family protein n=1 Tax=Xanthobacter autotrophicus (strain ATCC BAA-1158 / Py2) TaxID=78245 RepID=UPI00372BCC6D
MVRVFEAAEVEAALGYERLVPALGAAFADAKVEAPVRQSYEVGQVGAPAHLLAMPAWRRGAALGVKIVNIFPANAARNMGSVHGLYVLFDGSTGVPKAILDAEALTNRRTAATSALASSFLSRMNSETLTVVGTGHLAFHLAQGHCFVRPIGRVLVWGRSLARAQEMAARLKALGLPAEAAEDLSAAVRAADIVTCATTSVEPLVLGRDVRPGTHVDLVGAFTPVMRESDDDLVAKSAVYVDTYGGALAEAGDLLQPAASGRWSKELVRADLHELCAGLKEGRTESESVTLFKSVGAALEDLVAAELVAG